MRKNGKKLLSLALALVMVLGMLPVTALAAFDTMSGGTGILGQVLDEKTGQPPESVTATLRYDDESSDIFTVDEKKTVDSDGKFQFTYHGQGSEFPAGNYTLTFTSPFYLTKTVPIQITGTSGCEIVQQYLTPGGSIYGTVTDAQTGAVLSGVAVKAMSGSSVKQTATTDSAGQYRLDLESGTYSIEFSKANYQTKTLNRSFGPGAEAHIGVDDVSMTSTDGGEESLEIINSGDCGATDSDHIIWSLDSSGQLRFCGTGQMCNYQVHNTYINGLTSSVPWFSHYYVNRHKEPYINSVIIDDGITSLGEYCFFRCSATNVTLSNSVTSIGRGAFGRCYGLDHITIPDSVISIGDGAFEDCTGLTSVTIPNSVTSIGDGAFRNCTGLTGITIPDSVTSIGSGAFSYCTGLTAIRVDSNNQVYTAVDGVVFSKFMTELVQYPTGMKGSYTIPNGVTSIEKSAFSGCVGLTSVTIPSTITSIGDYAFYHCTGLKDVYYGGNEAQWKKIKIDSRYNSLLRSVTIHYNSTGSDIPVGPGGEDIPIGPGAEVISFTCGSYSVNKGEELLMQANVRSDADQLPNGYVTWSSSNEAVATVTPSNIMGTSAYANVRGIARGTTTITATTADGKSAQCTVEVTAAPNVIQLPADVAMLVDETKAVQAQITLNLLATNESVEWTTSNSSVVAFDSNGSEHISHPISGTAITDSKITDSVQIYARASGQAKITCKLKGTGAEKSFNVTVTTVNQEELQRLAIEWLAAYDEYNSVLKQTLDTAASGDIKSSSLEDLAKEFEEKLGDEYGMQVSKTGLLTEQRVLVYKALLEMLASYTSNQLALANISFSNLDEVPVNICNNVLNAIQNETYNYVDEETGASVTISLSDFSGARWGWASINHPEMSGTAMISSSESSVKAVIADYTSQLLDLEKAALKKSAKEAVAALSKELLGKPISKLKEDFIKDKVSKFTDQFNKLGLGNVVGTLNTCYNYYQFVDKVIGGDYSELGAMLAGTKDIDFTNPDFSTNITKKALKEMQNVHKEILKVLGNELSSKDKWLSTESSVTVSRFACPVNITVYDSAKTKVGYVGNDDIWFDEDVIYIEQRGESKVVYSRGEKLTFDIIATDYGTLNCTFEEYSNGTAVSRVNYYDIPLIANKNIVAEIPKQSLTEQSVIVKTGTDSLSADDSFSAGEYASNSINVICSADSADGGQIYGGGQYVRGDAVKLLAAEHDDFAFLGWQNSKGTLLSISPVYEFTAKEDVELTALFAKHAAQAANRFTDVPSGSWYYDAVQWAVEQRITNGTGTATFSPNNSCTRAQMATFLWRAAGSPKPKGSTNPFTDVQPGTYYYDAVLWAVEQEITNGTSATIFSPDTIVTRAQTVTFLYRMANSPAVSGSNPFTDVPAGMYYSNAVQWAVGKGITNGTSATTFSPDADCTRGQIVTFLYRAMAE